MCPADAGLLFAVTKVGAGFHKPLHVGFKSRHRDNSFRNTYLGMRDVRPWPPPSPEFWLMVAFLLAVLSFKIILASARP